MVRPLSSLNLALNRRGGPAAAVPFEPSDVTGLVAHWDAQDDASFVFSSGTTVQTWLDQTAHDNDAGVDGAGTAPERVEISGRKYVQFDGVDEFMVVADAAPINFGSGDFTLIFVYRANDTNRGGLMQKTDAEFMGHYTVRINDADLDDGDFVFAVRDQDDPAGIFVIETAEDFNDNTFRSAMCARDGNNLRVYSENVETPASPTDITGLGDLDTNLELNIGSNSQGGGDHLLGEIGEILMYSNAISSGDRASIQTYLDARWGL